MAIGGYEYEALVLVRAVVMKLVNRVLPKYIELRDT